MAVPKRLGRGLGSIIAGGDAPSEVSEQKTAPKPKKKSAKKSFTESEPVPAAPQTGPADTFKPTSINEIVTEGFHEIDISKIDISNYQPRTEFDEDGINELAESIRAEGLIQPITVRKKAERFELIAGERRLRACRKLELKRIFARIIDASDSSSAVISLIENLMRRNLNPIEEAFGFASLMDDFNMTQEIAATRVGKSRSSIANFLRLLQLNKECQGYVRKELLSFGHARALLALESQEEQSLLARHVIEKGMSVRDTERAASAMKKGKRSTKPGRTVPAAEETAINDLEKRLSNTLNTKVSLKHAPKKGSITIEYYGNEDLQRILDKLGLEHSD